MVALMRVLALCVQSSQKNMQESKIQSSLSFIEHKTREILRRRAETLQTLPETL